MSDELIPVFEYPDDETRGKLQAHERLILKHKTAAAKSLIDVCKELVSANETLAHHGDGIFGRWVEIKCGISRTQARRLIAVGRDQELVVCANLAQIEDSALYALAESETPKKAKKEALGMAANGQVVTHSTVRKLIEKHTPKQEPEPEEEEPEDGLPEGLAEAVTEAVEAGELEATQEQLAALAEYEPDSQEEFVEAIAAGLADLDTLIETGEIPQPSTEDRMAEDNKEIDAFGKGLRKWWDENVPDLPWLHHQGLLNTAKQQLESAIRTVYQAKCHGVCPLCDGNGCKHCLDYGAMPKRVRDQVA